MTSPAQPHHKQSIVPPQHGGWAFVGLPVLLGAMSSPWTPLLLILAAAWICAFPVSYFATAMLRYPRPGRFLRPLALWAAAAVPLAVVLLVARPWLLWIGLGYGVAFGINVTFARRHEERSLANDLVFILECAAIIPITWAVGVGSTSWQLPDIRVAPNVVWVSTAACALVLIGSTLHVKSLIRERSDARFRLASQIWALACLPVSLVFALVLGLPLGATIMVAFAFLAIRAFEVGRKPLPPGRIGMIELLGFLLLVVGIALGAY